MILPPHPDPSDDVALLCYVAALASLACALGDRGEETDAFDELVEQLEALAEISCSCTGCAISREGKN